MLNVGQYTNVGKHTYTPIIYTSYSSDSTAPPTYLRGAPDGASITSSDPGISGYALSPSSAIYHNTVYMPVTSAHTYSSSGGSIQLGESWNAGEPSLYESSWSEDGPPPSLENQEHTRCDYAAVPDCAVKRSPKDRHNNTYASSSATDATESYAPATGPDSTLASITTGSYDSPAAGHYDASVSVESVPVAPCSSPSSGKSGRSAWIEVIGTPPQNSLCSSSQSLSEKPTSVLPEGKITSQPVSASKKAPLWGVGYQGTLFSNNQGMKSSSGQAQQNQKPPEKETKDKDQDKKCCLIL